MEKHFYPRPSRSTGIVVNRLRGDASEVRAHAWLDGASRENLEAAVLGISFDNASTVRAGSRHGPDAVRSALAYYTTYSSATGGAMSALRAADLGDVRVVPTDMSGTFARIREVARELVARGVFLVSVGGDHSVTWPLLEGVCAARGGQQIGIVHFDAHHDLHESHFGAESSGLPFRKALGFAGTPIRGCNMVQLGMAEFTNSPVHADYAREMGITVVPGLAVRREGMESCVERALAIAGDGTQAIYVSTVRQAHRNRLRRGRADRFLDEHNDNPNPSTATRAGPSTSRRPPAPGSMRWKASSPSVGAADPDKNHRRGQTRAPSVIFVRPSDTGDGFASVRLSRHERP